jgi:hypothetical protein
MPTVTAACQSWIIEHKEMSRTARDAQKRRSRDPATPCLSAYDYAQKVGHLLVDGILVDFRQHEVDLVPVSRVSVHPTRPTLHQRRLLCRLHVSIYLKGNPPEYRATVADVVYQGIIDVLKAPDGDRFIVIGEHSPDNLIYDPHFLGWDRSPDFILIQVTSTVGNNKDSKLAFFRYIADELKTKLSVRPDDIMINLVFVDRSDWSFGNGDPWN